MEKKVLHICMSDGKGGMELYVDRICSELSNNGWKVYGVALAHTKVSSYMRSLNLETKEFKSVAQSILGVLKVTSWIKRENISVVHCHKSSDLRLSFLLKKLVPELKVFFTDHVGGSSEKKDFYHRVAYGSLERVFSISNATYERNVKNLPVKKDKITVLHHGVDTEKFKPCHDKAWLKKKKADLKLPSDCLLVGLPGRVTPGKGQDTWIKALGLLADKEFVAVSIGGTKWSDGGIESFHDDLVNLSSDLGLNNKVNFLGAREDVEEILKVLDIVCIPSKNEAFGLTIIESMATGKPIIGSNAGSVPELLDKDCGLLAVADDPEDWAAKITLLLEDSDMREKMGAKARERALKNFSQAKHAEQLAGYYRDAFA